MMYVGVIGEGSEWLQSNIEKNAEIVKPADPISLTIRNSGIFCEIWVRQFYQRDNLGSGHSQYCEAYKWQSDNYPLCA